MVKTAWRETVVSATAANGGAINQPPRQWRQAATLREGWKSHGETFGDGDGDGGAWRAWWWW